MKNIGFAGFGGSGKTESAKYLKNTYCYEIMSFAEPIKFIDEYVFGKTQKDRGRLQRQGEFFRSENPDIWVDHLERRINGAVVVDDLRRMNELEMLWHNGFVIVRIVADEDKRVQRLIERDGQCDVSLLYNESEMGVVDIEMMEIENNGTLLDLYVKLDKLVMSKLL